MSRYDNHTYWLRRGHIIITTPTNMAESEVRSVTVDKELQDELALAGEELVVLDFFSHR